MGNTVSLSAPDLRSGAQAVAARLAARAADPDKRLRFTDEDVGPLARGCPTTPLGYALLADDLPLLDVLLEGGADPSKPVGLPHRFNLLPLHLAAALGRAEAVGLLLAHGAKPNTPLRYALFPPLSPAATTSPPSGSWSVLDDLHYLQEGDRPLHLAAAARDGGSRAATLQVLLSRTATNVNARNARNHTPLYKACRRRASACVTLLAAHPRVDVNARPWPPLFAAIHQGRPELVRVLLQAGAKADGSVRNGRGQTPLQYAVYRVSLTFVNRAEIVSLLVGAGAVVETAMLEHAEEYRWPRVHAALGAQEALSHPSSPLSSVPRVVSIALYSILAGITAGGWGPHTKAAAVLAVALDQAMAILGGWLPQTPFVSTMPGLTTIAMTVALVNALAGGSSSVSLAPLAAVMAARFIMREVGYVATGLQELVAVVPMPAARDDASVGGALGGSSGGNDGASGGPGEMCCVCMASRAVFGFAHVGAPVHCCLCAGCEAELRRRRGLARCLFCAPCHSSAKGDRRMRSLGTHQYDAHDTEGG
ncbi:Serine/threonine-protein phosphatase 6 regulatory ankyrin repeat subunit C [Tetrabaena socialis]|uniref:Serine/threonine-protein phosphatase 6 regulatory ankyrin repeat subunit C n=1 Tax=Tetrabaena socialis TaxID=47790 RepID=A0A2J8ABH3_9CHLO|nr:Serine/threonine-protein phosphatase 6 regulatory ankyrin repeat subunit C [Tetrabaena socialis]|eukprot:PNH09856.1 Serine/threonine-protein phosphatase 6 regulatory ankyrin repeat subunit C [Tetrabaena socialis]